MQKSETPVIQPDLATNWFAEKEANKKEPMQKPHKTTVKSIARKMFGGLQSK